MSKPSSDILERLFGSAHRVRLMRLFFLNPGEIYDTKTLALRISAKPAVFVKELRLLNEVGFIRRGTKVVTFEQGTKHKLKKKKIEGYGLDRDFPYLAEFASLLTSRTPYAREELLAGIKKLGKVNLLVIAGNLIGSERKHVDVFLVGDAMKKTIVEKMLQKLEAELGRELVYAMMTTEEFKYRYGMYDRFLKDLFDNPHELLFNKLGIG